MDYYKVKWCWPEEVFLKYKPEIWELNALKDEVPTLGVHTSHP